MGWKQNKNDRRIVPTYVCDCGYCLTDDDISTGQCPKCDAPILEQE